MGGGGGGGGRASFLSGRGWSYGGIGSGGGEGFRKKREMWGGCPPCRPITGNPVTTNLLIY